MGRFDGRVRRRELLAGGSGLALASLLDGPPAHAAASDATPPAPSQNRAPLEPQPYLPLRAGSIRPCGWLRRQLEVQARGMGGRLDEVWPDVGPNSGWLGGSGESWERGPYFIDGLLPLAWALDDPALKAKADRFIEWTLASQRADGMFGPATNDDWWPRMVMLKVLTQHEELTGDPRVAPLMTRYFHHQLAALPDRPLRDWGRFRWQDELVSVVWLYNRTGDPKLLDLARLLQRQGWDWRAMFADFPFPQKLSRAALHLDDAPGSDTRDLALSAHGVNNAMGIKASAVWSLVSRDPADRAAVQAQLATLDRYHGMPTGMFSADEHLAGLSPSQGVELCAVVETMFSLEQALAVTGDPALADRLERIAFNALPATFTDDMWSHQYDQQTNQIRAGINPGPWTSNGDQANMFGLEPHFGCCTANFHQGWPKLLNSLWMATSDGGLAAMVHAPSEVRARVRGVPVRVTAATDYPFGGALAWEVAPERPVAFPLRLRVPAWAQGVALTVNGEAPPAAAKAGFVTLARTWRAGDRVEMRLSHQPRLVAQPWGGASVYDGALLFALPVGERWTKLRQRGLSADWRTEPTTAWNWGLVAGGAPHRVDGATASTIPFARATTSAFVEVDARRAASWRPQGAYAPPPPTDGAGSGPVERLRLVPYGAAKLRVAAFPLVGA